MKSMMTIVFSIACFCACAQNIGKGEKKELRTPVLTIVTPFVLYGEISDEALIKKLRDSLFDTYMASSAYKRNGIYEKSVHDRIIGVYKKYFKKYYDLRFIQLSQEDSTMTGKDLYNNRIKKNEKAGAARQAPASLSKIYSKYSKDDSQFLFTSVIDYYLKDAFGAHRPKAVAFTLMEVYIIDARQQLIFYNYKVNKWLGGPGGVIRPDIRQTVKGFVKKKA